MVEFALVAPIFFLMFFGLIEFALINATITTFNFAAKDAARIGSLLGRTDPTVDQQMVNDVIGRSGGFVVAQAQLIEIFRSDAAGSLPPATSPVENSYPPTAGSACSVCSWAVASRNDSLLNADYLGVRITYTYTYLTGFVSGGAAQLQLSALSVQRIEPQDFQGHRLPPHPPALLAASAHGVTTASPASSGATLGSVSVVALGPQHPGDDGVHCSPQPVAWLREHAPSLWRALGGMACSTGGTT